jgi:5-methylcytosine-specific restriction endonuclease McrA
MNDKIKVRVFPMGQRSANPPPSRKAKHKAVLESPRWRNMRRLVMERAGGICEACRLHDARHVHHKTYKRLGKERLKDLLAVCPACHMEIHGIDNSAYLPAWHIRPS